MTTAFTPIASLLGGALIALSGIAPQRQETIKKRSKCYNNKSASRHTVRRDGARKLLAATGRHFSHVIG
jgi:hypothetical protein